MKSPPLLLTVVLMSACGAREPGPPRIEIDRTACAHCGMFVSEPIYAAAYRAPGAEARVFDDISCLLEGARGEAQPDGLAFWFHDGATGEWIGGDDAVFVHSSSLSTPMGGGLIAYRDREAAARAAAEHRGRIVGTLQDLRRRHATGRKEGEE